MSWYIALSPKWLLYKNARNARKKFSLASWACKTCFRNIRDKRKFIRTWKSLNLITALQIRVFHYANALPTNFIRCALFLFITQQKFSYTSPNSTGSSRLHNFSLQLLAKTTFSRDIIYTVFQINESRIFIFRFFYQFILNKRLWILESWNTNLR